MDDVLYLDRDTQIYYYWDGNSFVKANVQIDDSPLTDDEMDEKEREHRQKVKDDQQKNKGNDDPSDKPDSSDPGPKGGMGGKPGDDEGGEQGDDEGDEPGGETYSGPSADQPKGDSQGSDDGQDSSGEGQGSQGSGEGKDSQGPKRGKGSQGSGKGKGSQGSTDGSGQDSGDKPEDGKITKQDIDDMAKKAAEELKKIKDSLNNSDEELDDEDKKETAERLQKIKDFLTSPEKRNEMSSENIKNIKNNRKARNDSRKAASDNMEAWGKSNASKASTEGILRFKKDLEDFMKKLTKQYSENSYKHTNRRTVYDPSIKMPGKRKYEKFTVPYVGIYFDQSSSWGENDIERGKAAIACLYNYQKKKKVKFDLKFFADEVSTDPNAVGWGGTSAGGKILKDILLMGYDNVIIMTDDDFDSSFYRDSIMSGPNVDLPGAVWFLWKNGRDSSNLKKKLTAKRVKEFNI